MIEYMEILSEDDAWESHAMCVTCNKKCLTPTGLQTEGTPATPTGFDAKRQLHWYVAGTVCVDVSMMGNRMALLGESSVSLAIFLSLVKRNRPQIVTHECTSFFSQFLFDEFLPEYRVHRLSAPDDLQHSALRAGFQSGTWLVSPHQMGWPCYRPRLFVFSMMKCFGGGRLFNLVQPEFS